MFTVRLSPTFRLPLAAATALLLSNCYTWQPPNQTATGTGVSLDAAPSRNREDTRYLERSQTNRTTSTPEVPSSNSSSTRYETPSDISVDPPSSSNTTASSNRNKEDKPSTSSTTSTDSSTTEDKPTTSSSNASTSDSSAPTAAQMPFGIPVPGKKGFVYSPYDKTQMVDVRGITPGKKVRCPYTSKIFLVP